MSAMSLSPDSIFKHQVRARIDLQDCSLKHYLVLLSQPPSLCPEQEEGSWGTRSAGLRDGPDGSWEVAAQLHIGACRSVTLCLSPTRQLLTSADGPSLMARGQPAVVPFTHALSSGCAAGGQQVSAYRPTRGCLPEQLRALGFCTCHFVVFWVILTPLSLVLTAITNSMPIFCPFGDHSWVH